MNIKKHNIRFMKEFEKFKKTGKKYNNSIKKKYLKRIKNIVMKKKNLTDKIRKKSNI